MNIMSAILWLNKLFLVEATPTCGSHLCTPGLDPSTSPPTRLYDLLTRLTSSRLCKRTERSQFISSVNILTSSSTQSTDSEVNLHRLTESNDKRQAALQFQMQPDVVSVCFDKNTETETEICFMTWRCVEVWFCLLSYSWECKWSDGLSLDETMKKRN